jgi:hypothetical protein
MDQGIDGGIRVELKYCERCGGLWFRRFGSGANLCGPCTVAEVRNSKKRARTAQDAGVDGRWFGPMSGVVKSLQGVASGRLG